MNATPTGAPTAGDAAEPGDDAPEPGDGRGPRRAPAGWTLVALVVALCFLAGAVGWTLGSGRPPGRASADVGFLHDMRGHHEGAIDLAQLQLWNGSEDSITVFAEEILRFQAYEIGLMDQMLLGWGFRPENRPATAMAWMGHETRPDAMPGMATPAELERLRTAGPETDAVFVALMVDHHAAGAAMAEEAAARAGDADVRALARRMASVQRAEIDEMLTEARRLGLDLAPAGVRFDVHDPDGGAEGPAHGHD
jgi:uncharacterized protein (DUF305 family)